jgi:hypothetical protein
VPYNDTFEQVIYSENSRRIGGYYTAFNPCLDYKMLEPGSVLYGRDTYNCSFLHHLEGARGPLYSNAIKKAYINLDFQDNNNFELIPFLMDWDSTMEMFSKKFLKQISYGSVTWGVLPFMSDVKSLVATLKDINSGIVDSYSEFIGKKISRRVQYTDSFNDGVFQFEVSGTINYNGYVTGELAVPNNALDAILIMLDELGIHPDLKTAWDVIPLSFALDYLVPIGDLLETAHPRGWFNPQFIVTGGHSVKATVKLRGLGRSHSGYGGTYKFYDRRPGTIVLGSRAPVDPEFKTPDLKELFNLGYLGLSTRNKR